MSVCRRSFIVLACAVAAASLPAAAYAAPPITVTSKTPADGPIKYTVKVASKTFGNVQETRTIRSGQTDDFNWKTVPPGGAVAVGTQCPNYSALTLDANGAAMRSLSIRLAPIVASDGTAAVQMSVQASAPQAKPAAAKPGAKSAQCPSVTVVSQVVRFSMPTNGASKTVSLKDGTKVTVSAQR
ncbi:DUF6013 family protein [Trinickia caryophylli]|uniref:Uncharacterized protein n=1 Tax=Trinickia caryophylli TaxID=28094 RepID=A0A1X7FXU6_TRICW|nr:DUF6013 family protein [Trinickia caryophylli]PMS11692.1 hypothetical protein C0Z17_12710 [Trinickia caryophylli]TRX17370.1 hypothetical protein FNF07_03395 [Trinickia caryophylli]WQE11889.1 DUF6013 family protein [Trinickia caryophylli]SMF60680.1 hypothetical protein SAMN06295900_112151 [Trinickia caryophylli]GLU34605.1 hypothetical protein Busp01_44470 [Trinickia caryophylli]